MLQNLSKLNSISWLASCTGRWDIVLRVESESIKSFDINLNEILRVCGDNLQDHSFSTIFDNSEKQGQELLDDTDKLILSIVSEKARIPVSELAKMTQLPVHIVSYRLKQLFKKKVLLGYKPLIRLDKAGYQNHLIFINFQNVQQSRKKDFFSYSKKSSKVFTVDSTLGNYNAVLKCSFKSAVELRDFLLGIRDNFQDLIDTYDVVNLFSECRLNHFTKRLLKPRGVKK